jgi:hypothetical protein
MRPKSPAHRRMLARQRAVQERPTAYAESPRPLRHEGPTDRSAACPPNDRNVAVGIVGTGPVRTIALMECDRHPGRRGCAQTRR